MTPQAENPPEGNNPPAAKAEVEKGERRRREWVFTLAHVADTSEGRAGRHGDER